jgi:hypothetical protein
MTLYELRPGKVTYPSDSARYVFVETIVGDYLRCRLLDDNLEHITSFILGKGEMLMWKKEKVECEADDLLSAKAFLLWG